MTGAGVPSPTERAEALAWLRENSETLDWLDAAGFSGVYIANVVRAALADSEALDRLLLAQNRWLRAQGSGQPLLTTLSALVLRGSSTPMTSIRIERGRTSCAATHWAVRRRSRATLRAVTASAG